MTDDRTAKARLRDAAIELIAKGGVKALSARAVADRAGLSQGLIRHHFGSMAALLQECDAHVAGTIAEGKEEAIAPGPGFDPLASLKAEGREFVVGYLAARLSDESAQLDDLVDKLIQDAESYIVKGIDAGVLRPMRDPAATAAALTIYSLGSVVMHRQVRRHLGLDFNSAELAAQRAYLPYVRLQLEIFESLFDPAVIDSYTTLLDSPEERA